MSDRAKIRARAAELRAGFEAAGAQVVEPPLLQPAGTLLDLYGEDIRARAFTTGDGFGQATHTSSTPAVRAVTAVITAGPAT